MIKLTELDLDDSHDVLFLYETRRHPDVDSMLFGSPPADWESHRRWLEAQHLKRRILFLIKCNDAPVGYCQMSLQDHPRTELGWVVAPSAQRQGFGTAAVKLLLDEARRRGFAEAELFVKAENAVAWRLYLKHGFHIVGEKDGAARIALVNDNDA